LGSRSEYHLQRWTKLHDGDAPDPPGVSSRFHLSHPFIPGSTPVRQLSIPLFLDRCVGRNLLLRQTSHPIVAVFFSGVPIAFVRIPEQDQKYGDEEDDGNNSQHIEPYWVGGVGRG
jgi:hypothetical protein